MNHNKRTLLIVSGLLVLIACSAALSFEGELHEAILDWPVRILMPEAAAAMSMMRLVFALQEGSDTGPPQ